MADKPHARLAPSFAASWVRCPLAVRMAELYGDGDENQASAEGTILHDLMERCLRDEIEPYEFVGRVFKRGEFEIEFTDELADTLMEGLDMIEAIPGKLFIEKRVKLDRWMPGQFGTLDIGIIGRRRITIWDHKFGMNPVSPVESYQLRPYALGFWDTIARHLTDVTDFRLIIWQPRVPGGGGIWDTTLDDLLEFGTELRFAAKATEVANPKANPGAIQCKYCPGAKTGKCADHHEYALQIAVQDFDNLDDNIASGIAPRIDTRGLTPERRSYLLEHRPMINQWFERMHAQAIDDALVGRPVPGLKLVEGRNPPRKWKDKDEAAQRVQRLLGDDGFKRQVKTPKQIEGELTANMWGTLGDLVDRGNPKPILVDERDARPAIPSLTDLFDD